MLVACYVRMLGNMTVR